MDLRELKKEVHGLEDTTANLKKLQENWIKPIRSNTNFHLPFLQNLDSQTKKELNRKLIVFQEYATNLKHACLHEKLRSYAHYLIELKLTELRKDQTKSTLITNRFLHDDFFNFKQTINDIKFFDDNLQKLSTHYEEINKLLHQKLLLEDALLLMDLPHKLYMQNLIKIAKKQKKIVGELGRHFVTLARRANK